MGIYMLKRLLQQPWERPRRKWSWYYKWSRHDICNLLKWLLWITILYRLPVMVVCFLWVYIYKFWCCLTWLGQGPYFPDISSLIQQEHLAALCSLVASVQRCVGLWRLEEVASGFWLFFMLFSMPNVPLLSIELYLSVKNIEIRNYDQLVKCTFVRVMSTVYYVLWVFWYEDIMLFNSLEGNLTTVLLFFFLLFGLRKLSSLPQNQISFITVSCLLFQTPESNLNYIKDDQNSKTSRSTYFPVYASITSILTVQTETK